MNFPGRESVTDTGIRVIRDQPDTNHLAWSTLRQLGYTDSPPGSPYRTAKAFIELMRNQCTFGTVYVTPMSKVIAPGPTLDFIRTARQEQLAWFRRLKDWLFSIKRVKRHFASSNALIRQLEFTGVMVIEGRHVLPDSWPEPHQTSETARLAGRTFGKLVVIEDLPRATCRCRCQCPLGKETIVRRKHLLAGRTKSCGCERANQEARLRLRRAGRVR